MQATVNHKTATHTTYVTDASWASMGRGSSSEQHEHRHAHEATLHAHARSAPPITTTHEPITASDRCAAQPHLLHEPLLEPLVVRQLPRHLRLNCCVVCVAPPQRRLQPRHLLATLGQEPLLREHAVAGSPAGGGEKGGEEAAGGCQGRSMFGRMSEGGLRDPPATSASCT